MAFDLNQKLVVQDIACRRGGRLLFAGLSFAVAAGEMLVLRGPNGVGKTSLLRVIAGFLRPEAGKVELQGGLIDTALAQQCHYVAHQNAIKPQLTVVENLRFWAAFMGDARARRTLDAALAALRLNGLRHLHAGVLSAGQKRRLALARLACVRRPVWLLDEPTVGLDVDSQAALCELMRTHLDEGGLIIASTHVDFGMPATRTLELKPLAEAPGANAAMVAEMPGEKPEGVA